MNQEEIQELLHSSGAESDPVSQVPSQVVSQVVSQEYPQEFDDKLESIADEDRIKARDEDMSEAQSQFVESSKLNIDKFRVNDRIGSKKEDMKKDMKKEDMKRKVQQGKTENAKPIKQLKQESKQQSIEQTKAVKAKKEKEKEKEKQSRVLPNKRSKEEIEENLRRIQEQKKQIQEKKERSRLAQVQKEMLEYQQAKVIEEQKKQKNHQVYLEQQKKKKNTVKQDKDKYQDQKQDKDKKQDKKQDDLFRGGVAQERRKKKKMEEMEMRKLIQVRNKQQLKRLNKLQEEDNPVDKKAKFLEERKGKLKRMEDERKNEAYAEDVLAVKQLKAQIMEQKEFNKQKQEQIRTAEKSILELTKVLKNKQKLLYEQPTQMVDYVDYSQLSPIEQFVYNFPNAKSPKEIFQAIDSDHNQQLTLKQIQSKLLDLGVSGAKQIYDLLDKNLDGAISVDEFTFFIQLEMKKQRDFRQIMGGIHLIDPIDIQAHILDMQTKLRFIDHQLQKSTPKHQDQINHLQAKVDKLETTVANKDIVDDDHIMGRLNGEAIRLQRECQMERELLDTFKKSYRENIEAKNGVLRVRVEQNLRLQEQTYLAKNELQQLQLRELSSRKIEQNKRGYVERQSEQRRQIEENYRRGREYQLSIADPTRLTKNANYAQQMRLLSAVLVIQRNYRKRKANK